MKQFLSIFPIAILFSANVTASSGSLMMVGISSNRFVETGLTITSDINTGFVKINFKAHQSSAATLLVVDQTGTVVLKQDAVVQAGNNTIIVQNFTNLNEGAYNVYVKAGKATYKSTYLLWK